MYVYLCLWQHKKIKNIKLHFWPSTSVSAELLKRFKILCTGVHTKNIVILFKVNIAQPLSELNAGR